MNKDALEEAIKALRIQNVYLRDLHAEVASDFDVLMEDEEVEVQYRLSPRGSSLIEYGNDQADEKSRIFRVEVDAEIRFFRPLPSSEESEKQRETRIKILAKFFADYEIETSHNPRQEALDEFALKNVGYHVWPYWRELVQSTCARLQLPPIVLPMYRLSGKKSESKSN